ncbi:MAG: aminotransferase class I/II-fold pyridoxal phosphate-dependent enzyme [Acholeplasmataceae bacterium]|nr:aminotransferase class I/II-fold pyridoxal phosphate-dependent enzyme [Acholeplasmataceae bacterium]
MKIHKPLCEAVFNYEKAKVYPLHTPGHKGGRGMDHSLLAALGKRAAAIDVSLMSELDDIHCPEGCLKEAQELAAQVYGSDSCFFAVNGTTGAIHAMLIGALKPGEKVLIPRNAHRAVAGALVLGGLAAVFLPPEYDEAFGINTQITPEAVEKALAADPYIKAVLVTSPNYYGLAADLKAIGEIAHSRGALLLVDEAHGAHLGFSAALPPSALQCGADACAQSTHKTLGALTQCSMLHVKGQRIDQKQIAAAMSLLTTTSPNYLLMASLDAARSQLAARGAAMAEAALAVAEKLRQSLRDIEGLKVLDSGILERSEVAGFDGTKVTVNVANIGITGIEAGEILRENGLAVELVDRNNVLFLLTYADDNEEIESIINKIKEIFHIIKKQNKPVLALSNNCQMPVAQQILSARQAFYADTEAIAFREAAGRICSEQISFYPPGIPVIIPGELLTEEIISYCQSMLALGLPVSGSQDGSLTKIQVVKQ